MCKRKLILKLVLDEGAIRRTFRDFRLLPPGDRDSAAVDRDQSPTQRGTESLSSTVIVGRHEPKAAATVRTSNWTQGFHQPSSESLARMQHYQDHHFTARAHDAIVDEPQPHLRVLNHEPGQGSGIVPNPTRDYFRSAEMLRDEICRPGSVRLSDGAYLHRCSTEIRACHSFVHGAAPTVRVV